MRVVGKQELRPLARSKALAAVAAAVALIGCSGVGTRAPATDITGRLAPSRAAANALRVDWTLSRECVVGGVEAAEIKGVSSSTASKETHHLRGTGGTVTFSADAFSTEGATVSLTCGDTTLVEETIAAPANPGSLALSRGGDYNVTAAWSLSRTCARSPQLRATATGSTPDIFALTGTSGSESLRNVHYRNVAATVELRCDGETLATETIAAPAGSLTLTRGPGDSLQVAWTLNPSCSAGEIAATPALPADGSAGDSRTISGTGGSIELTDSKYKAQGASATLDCNGARVATATIAAPTITVRGSPPPPAITGTLTLSRGDDYNVTAEWSLSRTCGRTPRVGATAGDSTEETFDLTGTSGSESLSSAKYRNVAVNVELRCGGFVVAKETIAAPAGSLTLTRGSGDSVKAAWTLNPSCAAGTVTTSPAGETQTHDIVITGTGGNVETTDSAYTTKAAAVQLKCNDAEIAAATIDAPRTATLALSRRPGTDFYANSVIADWTVSRPCGNGRITAVTADGLHTLWGALRGDYGFALYSGDYRTQAVTVTVTCDGKTLAERTIAAP